jgi:hypothetical protein
MTDISKDAVERHILRIDPSNLAQDRSLNSDTFIILRAQSVRIAELEAALQAMVDNYVYLTDTGDFGYGDAEAEPQMVASRAALKG